MFALYWSPFFSISFIPIVLSTAHCKKRYGGMRDERLSSLAILHIHKHKDIM